MLLFSRSFVLKTKSGISSSMRYSLLGTKVRSSVSSEQLVERSVHSNLLDTSLPLEDVRLLLAVSGGSDSVAMLHILQNIKKLLVPQLKLQVVNFNHKLRKESFEEVYDISLHSVNIKPLLKATFIESICKGYDIPFHSIEAADNQFSIGVQNAARDWRRQCYDKMITNSKVPTYVLTGHTLDDQTETLLMKLLRGVHLSNFQPVSYLRNYLVLI